MTDDRNNQNDEQAEGFNDEYMQPEIMEDILKQLQLMQSGAEQTQQNRGGGGLLGALQKRREEKKQVKKAKRKLRKKANYNPEKKYMVKKHRIEQYPKNDDLKEWKRNFDYQTSKRTSICDRGMQAKKLPPVQEATEEAEDTEREQASLARKIHMELLKEDMRSAENPFQAIKNGCTGCFSNLRAAIICVISAGVAGILVWVSVI